MACFAGESGTERNNGNNIKQATFTRALNKNIIILLAYFGELV
jgi:hypothetical protein